MNAYDLSPAAFAAISRRASAGEALAALEAEEERLRAEGRFAEADALASLAEEVYEAALEEDDRHGRSVLFAD